MSSSEEVWVDFKVEPAKTKQPRRGESVAHEALDTINGERQDVYGNPEDSFKMIADLWGAYLGLPVRPAEVADMMQLLKIARESRAKGKRDNAVDNVGYALLAAEMRGYK